MRTSFPATNLQISRLKAARILWLLAALNVAGVIVLAIWGGGDLLLPGSAMIVAEAAILVYVGHLAASACAQAEEEKASLRRALTEAADAHSAHALGSATAAGRADEMAVFFDQFGSEFEASTAALHRAALKLHSNAANLISSAARFNAQSVSGSIAADETRDKVMLVANAGAELSQSIAEVGESASGSSRLAANAVRQAEITSATINDMAAMAHEIGKVTDLISAIAGQTNLLALNATIEAARAGESGRGFAVVAQEVKELASQTALATRDIADRIGSMQSATARSVDAINAVSKIIRDLDEYSAHIAAAVGQQSVAAQEIAMNVESASSGVRLVSDAVDQIESLSHAASGAVAKVDTDARAVATQAEKLQEKMREFQARAFSAKLVLQNGA